MGCHNSLFYSNINEGETMTDIEKLKAKRSVLIDSLEAKYDIKEINLTTYAIQELTIIIKSL